VGEIDTDRGGAVVLRSCLHRKGQFGLALWHRSAIRFAFLYDNGENRRVLAMG
jgi:hypothetical protein